MPARSDESLISKSRFQWAGLDWRVFVLLFAISFAVVSAYVLLRPIYHHWRMVRSEQLARISLEQFQQRQFYPSQSAAMEAFKLGPLHLPTLRLLAERASQASPPEALQLYLRILQLPGAQTEDARDAVNLAMALKREDIAIPLLDNLLMTEAANPENLHLATRVALARKDIEGAISYARRAVYLAPSNTESQFLLAQSLYQNPSSREEARSNLLDVSEGISDESLKALVNLANDPALSPADRQLVLKRLRRHPKAQWQHGLLVWMLQMQNLPDDKRLPYLKMRLDSLEVTDDQLSILGRWLNAFGHPELTLERLPFDRARQREDWFLIYLDAMARLGQTRQLMALLDRNDLPLSETQRALYRARVASRLGDAQTEMLWGQVLSSARKDPEGQMQLARQLEAIQQPDLAFSVYRMMTQHPKTSRFAYFKLLDYYRSRRSTRGVWYTLESMAQAFPDDTELRQQALYTRLLLDHGDARTLQLCEDMVREQPSRIASRMTLALAYLKHQRPNDAMQQLPPDIVRYELLQPGWKAVYVATLLANGEVEQARELIKQIDMTRLLAEENSLLNGLLTSQTEAARQL